MRGQQEIPHDVPDCDTHVLSCTLYDEVEQRRHLLPPYGGAEQREVSNCLHTNNSDYSRTHLIIGLTNLQQHVSAFKVERSNKLYHNS